MRVYYNFNMSDYKYPDDLIKKTHARIKAQLKGNGVENIPFKIKRQGLGAFTAHTFYTIDCTTKTSEQKGRVTNGKIIPIDGLKKAVDSHISGLKNDKSTHEYMKHEIQALSCNGFGADKATIPLKNKSETFVSHVQCGSCSGKGESTCRKCMGKTREQCPMCHYTGELNCMSCQGRGMIQDPSNGQKQCTNCHGRGRVYCTNCNGQKTVPCVACHAKGTITCNSCGGKGEASKITTVTPTAHTTAQVNIQELDPEPKTLVSKAGAKNLAKGGHIDLKITKPAIDNQTDDDTAWYQDTSQAKQKPKGVHYTASVPWAVGELSYKDDIYNISLIGKKGAVADSAPFMDVVLKHPATLMKKAAQGDGVVASLLNQACEYRVSRETLSSVIKGKTKQSMMELQRTYGLGLSKPFIQSFVKATYLATKKITRRPRYIGLGIGIAIAAALYYFWFLMEGRARPEFQIIPIRYASDIVVLILGYGIAFGFIKAAAHVSMQSVLKPLNINVKKIPAAGMAGIYALATCTVLWGALFAFLFI